MDDQQVSCCSGQEPGRGRCSQCRLGMRISRHRRDTPAVAGTTGARPDCPAACAVERSTLTSLSKRWDIFCRFEDLFCIQVFRCCMPCLNSSRVPSRWARRVGSGHERGAMCKANSFLCRKPLRTRRRRHRLVAPTAAHRRFPGRLIIPVHRAAAAASAASSRRRQKAARRSAASEKYYVYHIS